MDQAETCYFCESDDRDGELAPWFVGTERRLIHTRCWIVAYRRTTDAEEALTKS